MNLVEAEGLSGERGRGRSAQDRWVAGGKKQDGEDHTFSFELAEWAIAQGAQNMGFNRS